MAKSKEHNVYSFYYDRTDTWVLVTESYLDAQEYAQKLKNKERYTVRVCFLNGDHYKDFTVDEFLEFPNPNPSPENINFDVVLDDVTIPSKDLAKEPYHNLDDMETMEVLKHTDTGFILGELARRLEEYNAFTMSIKEALDRLDINA